jgi:hypothetical protein
MPSSLWTQLSPTVTNLIRLDHSHVTSALHQYPAGGSARIRGGLADNVCLALEIHAQLEEEIFYPALRGVMDDEVLRKGAPDHYEMRGAISRLKALTPSDPAFDDAFFALMRLVLHHVADEETVLLPAAERLLPDQLSELGARMNKRRLELAAPRSRELAASVARSASASGVLAAASAVLGGGYLLARHHRPLTRTWTRGPTGMPPPG